MPRKVLVLFLAFFLTIPAWTAPDDRRDAIVVLDEPAVVEQLLAAEAPSRRFIRQRLLSREGEEKSATLRLNKGRLIAALRAAGAEVTGQTEVVLNSVTVRVTAAELDAIRRVPGVRSADFAAEVHPFMDAAPGVVGAPAVWRMVGDEENAGQGIKIAIIDSGIDQTHPMFQDSGFTPASAAGCGSPSSFPKGELALTNSKVIAARNFSSENGAADRRGHGTFVAGVAAGRRIAAQAPNGPTLSISGIAPKAYLGNYKVFAQSGSTTTNRIILAIEAAVCDGMDIINLSLGQSNPLPPSADPSAAAINNAVASGVLVVAAVGNSGPGARTLGSPATMGPVLSVGATTNSRAFQASARLTSPQGIPAELADITALPGNAPPPAVFGPGVLADVSRFDPSGLGCPPTSETPDGIQLPGGSLNGRVAFMQRGRCLFRDKVRNAANAGARAVMIYNHIQDAAPLLMDTAGSFIPSFMVGNQHGRAIRDLLARGTQISVSFDPTLSARPDTADIVTAFSSRGPVPGGDLKIKPDVLAPGQVILSAVQRIEPSGELFTTTGFAIERGTSFSSPMVAGAAALIKQLHPEYRPEVIKSLLANTADAVTRTEDGVPVHAQNSGAGRMNLAAAVAATMWADPVSLSFNARSPRGTFTEAQAVKITNIGSGTDTFTLSVEPGRPEANVRTSLDRSSLPLDAGASNQVFFTLSQTGIVQSVVDGTINVRSNNTGRTIRIPYWVTFLRPEVNVAGVVNAASFDPTVGVSPGSIVSIFGLSLAGAETSATALPLPSELGGATIQIGQQSMPLFFSSAGQVNGQIPYTTQFGSTITAFPRVDGISGESFTLQVNQFSPGLFSMERNGRGQGAILHANGTLVSSTSPARPGETVLVFGTGLGPVQPAPALGVPAASDPLSHTTTNPVVFVGDREAAVTFSGLAPGFVGLYQINVTLPSDLPAGDHGVILTIGGTSSNRVTISVR